MPVYSRKQLSGSSNGLPHQVTATAAGDASIIHQVQNTSTSAFEMLWLKLRSNATSDVVVRIVQDHATATGPEEQFLLEDRNGSGNLMNLFQGLPLVGTDTILRAYMATSTGNAAVVAEGYYNEIATG